MRNSQRRFSPRRIDQSGEFTNPAPRRSRNIITRNTIPARENYGEFFQGAPARNRTCERVPLARVRCCRHRRVRCCLPANSYVHAPPRVCTRVHGLRGCMHAVTFETLFARARASGDPGRYESAVRRVLEDDGYAVRNARRTREEYRSDSLPTR